MANNDAVMPMYNVLDMLGNRIAGVGAPVYANDVEVHGHSHTAAQLNVVSNTKIGVPNGVASLDEDGIVPSDQLPVLKETVTVDATILANKSALLANEINTLLPVRIFIKSSENYISPDLILGVDIDVDTDNQTLIWDSLGLDGLLESGDSIYVEFYKL